MLRLGGNEDDTRMVIAAAFQKQKSVEDIAALLQSTFHGGNGFKTPEGELSVWYAVDGIHIAPGRSAEYVRSAQVIAWPDAAVRISQLMDSGAYASNVELAEAGQHERMQLAQALWYLKHDLSDEAREQGYLSCMDTLRGGGFPDETARLAEQLTNTDFRNTLSGEFAQFYAAHEQDRSLLRFHYHKLNQIWQSLRELSLPRRAYSSEMAAVPELARFITEDEIDHALDRGSGVEGGNGRIYEYFTADHTGKEKAAFLKDEYGTGGHTHAVSGASGSYEDHSAKGITLKKAGCANVELSWTKVAARIDALIQKDRFLSSREKERYAQLQREKEAERTAQTDYNAIKEAHPDDIVLFQVGDFFEIYGEDAKQAVELLDLNLTTRAIPGAGRVEMCGLPSHNLEMYVEKLRDKCDVTIAEAPDFRGERRVYTLRSVDHEAEAAIDAYEAEFGADGTRVFRDPAAEQPQPTVAELFEGYKLTIGNALVEDEAFANACRNSDRQNAYLEGAAAIRRIVTESGDLQLTRLYFDMPAFHNRLHQELLDELYPTLATMVTPSPYKVTQADIDAALQQWNGRIESKHAVVRYMKAHARDRDTAAWLAAEYGVGDSSKPLQISVGNSEPVTLSWAKVQRRIAQLIQSDSFYTEQEQDNFDDIDPIAIREALAERGIVGGRIVDAEANRNSPFVRQVMADVERIAVQEAQAAYMDSPDRFSIRLHPNEGGITGIWDSALDRFYEEGGQVLRFAEQGFLSGFEADMKTLEAHPHPKDGFAGMEVKGDFLTDKDNAGAAILEAFKDAKGLEPVPIGSYRGFAMSLTVENFGKDFVLTLKGRMSHRVELGKDARGNLVRIDNALAQMPERYKTVQGRLENVQAQLATAKAELGKPFPQEAELKEKSARLAELNAELNIDDRTPLEQAAENVVAKRPSVLGKLKAPCVHGAGDRKKSHEQEAR